jgi:pimeloyl-ACP methyl ester carboxylesterase
VDKKLRYLNKEFHYYEYGSGKPLVLVHGFAEDAGIWNNQIDFLQKKFRLFIPDLPGCGSSAYNEQLSTIEDFAEIIRTILDNEQINETVLIGHSMGGYISLAFAAKYGKLLLGLGLFHSTAYPDSEDKKTLRRKSIDFIKEHGEEEFIKSNLPNSFSADFKANHPTVVSELVRKYSNLTPESLISFSKAMMVRPDRRALLKELNKPIMFIIGEEDVILPLQESLAQTHISDLAFIHLLKNTGHMGMIEHPALTGNWVGDFTEACYHPSWE